jgi:tetratricopeptide (TPR) repeat protein
MNINLKLSAAVICFQFLIAGWLNTAAARLPKNVDSMKAQDVYDLAVKSRDAKDYEDAGGLYMWAGILAKKQFGEDHEIVEKSRLAGLQVDLTRAEIKLAKAKATHGETDFAVSEAYNNLSQSWRNLGDGHKAVESIKSAIAIAEKLYGPTDSDLRKYYMSLGDLWRDLEEYEKALAAYDNAVQDDIDSFNSHLIGKAVILNNIALCLIGLNEHAKALPYLEVAWKNLWEYFEADYVDSEFAVAVKKRLDETKQKLGK